MQELNLDEIDQVSGGLSDLEKGAIALAGIAVGAASGGLGFAALAAAAGSIGCSGAAISEELR